MPIQIANDYGGTRENMGSEEKVECETYGINHFNFIPDAEVTNVKKIIDFQKLSSQEIKKMLATNRSCNRICDLYGRGCHNGTRKNLMVCPKCQLTWYCSKSCQDKLAKEHELWCCKQTTVDENGPLRVVICKIKD